MTKFVNVATPATNVTGVVPESTPPAFVEIVAAKVGAVAGVTVLLLESTIRITGWAVNAAPELEFVG